MGSRVAEPEQLPRVGPIDVATYVGVFLAFTLNLQQVEYSDQLCKKSTTALDPTEYLQIYTSIHPSVRQH